MHCVRDGGLAIGLLVLIATFAFFVPQSYLDRFRLLWDREAHHQKVSLDRSIEYLSGRFTLDTQVGWTFKISH